MGVVTMRGEFIGVWSETWREIWEVLSMHEQAPDDLFCELYREMAAALKTPPSVEALAEIIDNPAQSIDAFKNIQSDDLAGEHMLVNFFENVHSVLDDLGGDSLSNYYFNLLDGFVSKYSLRCDLRRPCVLCPTLSGMFGSLVRDLRTLTSQDAHLDNLMNDFENALSDLRMDCSDERIKACIQMQVSLLEAIGQTYPGVNGDNLDAICSEVGTWPHEKIKKSLEYLYLFASDYVGISNGGISTNLIRNIEMLDLVAVSIILTGFLPYLSNQLDAEIVYHGG
jgi:hypothetical protein